jgi:hypothetical protein
LQGPEVSSAIAQRTLDVNYFGVKSCLELFAPALRPNARVIVVSSRMGDYNKLVDPVCVRVFLVCFPFIY